MTQLGYDILWWIVGLLSGAAYLRYARLGSWRRERWNYAFGLVVAAAIYLIFAVVWGDGRWLLVETAGLVVYGAFAWLGMRHSVAWLAFGWATHSLWDTMLHLWGPGAHVAPRWYAIACLAFDVLVAGYILWRLRRWPDEKKPGHA